MAKPQKYDSVLDALCAMMKVTFMRGVSIPGHENTHYYEVVRQDRMWMRVRVIESATGKVRLFSVKLTEHTVDL